LLNPDKDSSRLRIFLKAALLLQIIALVYIGSRGSMLAVMLALVFIAFLKLNIGTLMAWFAGLTVSVVLVATLIQIFPDNVFSKDIIKQYSIERIKKSDNQRIGAWKVAFAKLAQGEDLVWGVGPRNYKAINDMEFVRQNEKFSQIKSFGHAHNLFLTQLIEQGIIGLLAMFFFFFLILQKIISIWRAESSHTLGWAWYGGIGGLTVPLIAGLFNTPFYQEHAMLAMIVIGMMFASTEVDSGDIQPNIHTR
jgi:O-antigen ligase